MSDYKNDSTSVKNSHNINKNRRGSDNYDFHGARGGQNISVMKTDSYNWLIGVVALLVIVISILSSVATIAVMDTKLSDRDEKITELTNRFELLSNYIVEKGVK